MSELGRHEAAEQIGISVDALIEMEDGQVTDARVLCRVLFWLLEMGE